MPIVIKEDPSLYRIPPEGLFQGVLVDVVDLGEQHTPWGMKHKLSLVFEVHEEDELYTIMNRYTWSISEKSNLRKDLERWRGKKYTRSELAEGINLEAMIGLNCTLYIAHRETEERTYANIETIMPPAKHGKKGLNWFGLKPSPTYTRVIDREHYLDPEEYAKARQAS